MCREPQMLIASKLNSRFNSTIKISSQFSSQFNSARQTSQLQTPLLVSTVCHTQLLCTKDKEYCSTGSLLSHVLTFGKVFIWIECLIKDTLSDSWPIKTINFVRFHCVIIPLLWCFTANQRILDDWPIIARDTQWVQYSHEQFRSRKEKVGWKNFWRGEFDYYFGQDSWQCSPGPNSDSIHLDFILLRFNSDSIQHRPDSIQTLFK